MISRANWNYPTAVRFGAGRIKELADACKVAGIGRPLFVTDPGLVSLPMTQGAIGLLRDAGLPVAVFADVKGNPVESNVYAGIDALRAGQCDGVVCFGGGSALDVGKTIAFMAGQTRPMWDFEDIGDWYTRADPKGIAPNVCVATTSGTGSEVGRASVITQEETRTKKVIFHPLMMPKVTILDPELTVGLPATITAWTGMDALSHALEAYCAPGFHPLADGIAIEAIRLVKTYLVRAVKTGTDIEARGGMCAAATMGATAFQKGLGGMHALSHPIGALFDTHHGLTNAVFMPYVLDFNRPVIDERISRLAAYLGLAPSFDAFKAWVLGLREDVGIPHTLAGIGVDDSRIDEIAAKAVVDPTAGGNPVELTVDAAKAIFRAALAG